MKNCLVYQTASLPCRLIPLMSVHPTTPDRFDDILTSKSPFLASNPNDSGVSQPSDLALFRQQPRLWALEGIPGQIKTYISHSAHYLPRLHECTETTEVQFRRIQRNWYSLPYRPPFISQITAYLAFTLVHRPHRGILTCLDWRKEALPIIARPDGRWMVIEDVLKQWETINLTLNKIVTKLC